MFILGYGFFFLFYDSFTTLALTDSILTGQNPTISAIISTDGVVYVLSP